MRSSIQIREEEHFNLLLQYAAEAGFREIAVSFGSTDVVFRSDFADVVSRMIEKLDRYGIACTQTHLPCYHLLVSAEETNEETENAIRESIRQSARLGAAWAAFHPRSAVNDGYNRKKSFESNKKMLDGYLEDAEKYGTGIAVENMPLYPFTRPDWRFFGGGWEELCELCDSFRSDKIGICWDFGHAHTAALDQAEAFRAIGNRLKITHVHDNYRNGDHHQLPLLASVEWNSVDWTNTMKALGAANYTGPLTLEVIYPPTPMLKSFVQCGFDSLTCLKEMARNG